MTIAKHAALACALMTGSASFAATPLVTSVTATSGRIGPAETSDANGSASSSSSAVSPTLAGQIGLFTQDAVLTGATMTLAWSGGNVLTNLISGSQNITDYGLAVVMPGSNFGASFSQQIVKKSTYSSPTPVAGSATSMASLSALASLVSSLPNATTAMQYQTSVTVNLIDGQALP